MVAPECLEAPAMRSKNGVRLNDPGHAEQAWPESGHPDQQRPVTAAQSTEEVRTSRQC
jgi:hypothetical protein